MTAIGREGSPGVAVQRNTALFIGLAFAVVGIAVGLGVSQFFGSSDARTAFGGPAVERSLVMQSNVNALIEGGQAQAIALAAAQSFSGPLVERSLAMDRNVEALIQGSVAQAAHAGSQGEPPAGPMAERSLAMDRNVEALIQGGIAQEAALVAGQ